MKVLCKVGGWKICAIPGTSYAFGMGGAAYGPIPLSEITEGMDVEGIAVAVPLTINTTPHNIRFQSAAGEVYEVPPCGALVNARPVEAPAGMHPSGATLVTTRFEADPASEEILAKLERENPGAIIVGSIIAAQAFPGRVFALVPVPGFERVPPAEKRMRDDKFTTFA